MIDIHHKKTEPAKGRPPNGTYGANYYYGALRGIRPRTVRRCSGTGARSRARPRAAADDLSAEGSLRRLARTPDQGRLQRPACARYFHSDAGSKPQIQQRRPRQGPRRSGRPATQTEGVKPKCDTNGGSETVVTVTSKRHAQAERAKRYKREEKAASCVVLPVPPNIEDLAERSQRVMSLSGGICCARLSVPINTKDPAE